MLDCFEMPFNLPFVVVTEGNAVEWTPESKRRSACDVEVDESFA